MRRFLRKGTVLFLLLLLSAFAVLPLPAGADIAADGKIVIVIDAGHGGIDGGTAVGSLTEKEINLKLAKYLAASLEKNEAFSVYLTRDEDVFLNFLERTWVGLERNADLFISLHCNSSGEPTATGCMAFVSVVNRFRADELAGKILDGISAVTPIARRRVETKEDTGDDLGIYYWSDEHQWDMPGAYELAKKSDYYSINTWSSKFGIPSMIIEHGYLSNANDDAVLADNNSLWAIAAAEAQAIVSHFTGHEHVFGEVETDFPSNCVIRGTASRRCTICGAKSETTALPEAPENHFWRYLEHKPATCTENGYMRGVCEIERSFSRQRDDIVSEEVEEILPAPGHVYQVLEEKAAGHGQDGLLRKRCTVCGDEIEEITPGEPHNYVVTEEVPSGCTSAGRRTERCTVCGDIRTETLPAEGHRYEVTRHVDPTDEEDGYEIRVCSVCGDEVTEVLSMCPHEFDVEEVPPTCTEDGLRTSVCRLCGYEKKEVLPSPGHQLETQMTVDPTCTEEGYYKGKCTACGEIVSERIPPAGHHLVQKEGARAGVYVCTICGAEMTESGEGRLPEAVRNPVAIVIVALVAAQMVAVAAILLHSRNETKKKRTRE